VALSGFAIAILAGWKFLHGKNAEIQKEGGHNW
jgi:hypothetical protein